MKILDMPEWLSEVCRRCELSEPARALAAGARAPQALVDALATHGLWSDALQVVAHLLAPRDAVWWGCLCGWYACRPKPMEAEAEGFRALMAWLQDPNEANGRAARVAAEKAGVGTPPGALGMAAFWCGSTLSKPALPGVEPPAFLYAKGVAAAVQLAASAGMPPTKRLQTFFRLAAPFLARVKPDADAMQRIARSEPVVKLERAVAPHKPAVAKDLSKEAWEDLSQADLR